MSTSYNPREHVRKREEERGLGDGVVRPSEGEGDEVLFLNFSDNYFIFFSFQSLFEFQKFDASSL